MTPGTADRHHANTGRNATASSPKTKLRSEGSNTFGGLSSSFETVKVKVEQRFKSR
jgi:hypothetical protein